ncbi:DUF6318 family protein [Nocardioides conyzicola]|uniref:DUF4878 domain-containing protein n=1 Tax=Nocardioides conyzicola TaxID=1651781 RepID=A0ABP8WLQ1_9ACTN
MIGDVSRTRAALTAFTLLSVLGLAGCTDDDPEPKFAPPSSEAPTSPSTSAAAALSPEDTVRAWVDAQNLAMTSGDSTEVRSLGTSDCESCDGLIDPIDAVIDAGGRFETSGWTVDRAKQVSDNSDETTVKAAVTIAAGRTYNSSDAEPVVYGVDRSILQFKLRQTDGRWLVAFVGFLS